MKVYIFCCESREKEDFLELTEDQFKLLQWLDRNGYFEKEPVKFKIFSEIFKEI